MVNVNIRPGLVVAGFGFLGMILAWLLQYLNENGYVVNEYVQDKITMPGLQIVVIIICLLVGVVVGVLTSK